MIGPLKPFNSFGPEERYAVEDFIYNVEDFDWPLSGYLAGKERGGHHVRALEDEWAKAFGVKHAIACNSATSGLMAAAFAIGLKTGDRFTVPTLTMSATVAAPMFTGATPIIVDVDGDEFTLKDRNLSYDYPVFATNLFGSPARLHDLRRWCDQNNTFLIEDNAQAPFAIEYGKYASTIGHIGIGSLNVHKPIQCGEGGMITTNYDWLASYMRNFTNHGENAWGAKDRIGLNLRMPEICAAIARVQLRRGPQIILGRIEQADRLISAIGTIPGIKPPKIRQECKSVYYTIPFLIERKRAEFCAELRKEGVPVVEGYALAHRLPTFEKFAAYCPTAEYLHDYQLFYIENCAYDLTDEQIGEIGAAFKKAAEKVL